MLRSLKLATASLFLILLYSCDKKIQGDFQSEGFELLYESDEFHIFQHDKEFILEVVHPYPGASASEIYHLYPRYMEAAELDNVTHRIPYPIDGIAISSTTHLGFLEALGMGDRVIGANNPQLFYSTEFNERLKNGEIRNIGGAIFDEELLIKLKIDVLFAFALSPSDLSSIDDLRESGIKVVMISEFLEADPMKKAEWLKFFAAFFGGDKLQKSNDLLNSIEAQYNAIKEAVAVQENKPTVMMGYPWKGSWHVSGGASYQAKFFKDAGANYIWSDFDQTGSIPLDIEVVLKKGAKTDFWLNPGDKQSISQILEANEKFSSFLALKQEQVYSNYARTTANGANDAWEKGVVRPDLILADLATIFHPNIIGERELYFYKQLEQ